MSNGKNEINVELQLFDTVSPGITVDIFVTIKLALNYDHNKKGFEIKKTHASHREEYHRQSHYIPISSAVSHFYGTEIGSVPGPVPVPPRLWVRSLNIIFK